MNIRGNGRKMRSDSPRDSTRPKQSKRAPEANFGLSPPRPALRLTDPPKGCRPGCALGRAAPRAQRRLVASHSVLTLHSAKDDTRPASTPMAARELDQMAPAPSFMYLQTACEASRGSVKALTCRRGSSQHTRERAGTRPLSHLQGLANKVEPRAFRAV